MRPMITLALAFAGFAHTQPAAGEIRRCGSVLIEPGDDALYVLEKPYRPQQLCSIVAQPALSQRNPLDPRAVIKTVLERAADLIPINVEWAKQ